MGPLPEHDFHNEGGLLAEEDADKSMSPCLHYMRGFPFSCRESSQLPEDRFLNPADF